MAIVYDYYRIFYYVAKYQSFTKAARVLMSNQPNVTRAMNKLEQELNCRLFIRSNRGVTLTLEGEKLYSHVQIAQEQLQAGESEIINRRNLEYGQVSVGINVIALYGLLLPVLGKFRLSYPKIHIGVMNHYTRQAISAVRSGQVDFAVVTTPTGSIHPLKVQHLVPFQDILIAGNHYQELRETTIRLQDLARYPLIGVGKESNTYEFHNEMFAEHGQKLQPDIEVATADQVLPMIRNHLGVGFLPKWFATEALSRGEVFQVKLEETIPDRYICLVQDTSRPMSVAAQELIRMIQEEAAES